MRFWDSSAVIPLLITEPTSGLLFRLLGEDSDMATWWGTWAECAVAISRFKRETRLDEEGEQVTRAVLDVLADDWTEQRPEDGLRLLASIISKYHPLKAADCLQLASALRWCEGDTSGTGFVCLDKRLQRAASDEGFDVLPAGEDES